MPVPAPSTNQSDGSPDKNEQKSQAKPKKRFEIPSLLTLLFKPVGEVSIRELLTSSLEVPMFVVVIKPWTQKRIYMWILLQIFAELQSIKSSDFSPNVDLARTKLLNLEDIYLRSVIFVDVAKANIYDKILGVRKLTKIDESVNRSVRYKNEFAVSEWKSFSWNDFPPKVFFVNAGEVKDVVAYLNNLIQAIGGGRIAVLKPRRLPWEAIEAIARAAWGFADFKCNKREDSCFSVGRTAFYSRLESLTADPRYGVVDRDDDDDSDLHYLLKVFTYRYFVEKLQVNPENVKVGHDFGDAKTDILVDSWMLAVDIETLYGAGFIPWSKLWKAAKKYRGLPVKEAWIVIPPFHFMLFAGGILKLSRLLRKEYGDKVRLYTVDLSQDVLVSVEEYAKKVREAIKLNRTNK